MANTKRRLCIGAIAAAIAASYIFDAFGADISFRPTASVSSTAVELKDVAAIAGGDPATLERLRNVVLAPAPAPGRRVRLEFEAIRSRLQASGIPSTELNFSGSSVIIVASAQSSAPPVKESAKRNLKVSVPAGQVRRAEQMLTEAIRRSLRAKHREAEHMFLEVVIEPSDVPAVFSGASGGFRFGAIDLHRSEVQAVDVHFEDVRGRSATFPIQCIVSERPQIPVLTRAVATGEVIHESDLSWRPSESAEGALTRVEQIVDKEAKKGLHAEEPIHPDDIRPVPLVRSNDIVTGVWRSGGIRISGQFKARGDGGLGDVITLVKLTGREQVMARVTDLHEAEIVSADDTSARKRAVTGDEGNASETEINQKLVRTSVPRSTKPPRPLRSVEGRAQFAGGETK